MKSESRTFSCFVNMPNALEHCLPKSTAYLCHEPPVLVGRKSQWEESVGNSHSVGKSRLVRKSLLVGKSRSVQRISEIRMEQHLERVIV